LVFREEGVEKGRGEEGSEIRGRRRRRRECI
jgi:hypothetical protein